MVKYDYYFRKWKADSYLQKKSSGTVLLKDAEDAFLDQVCVDVSGLIGIVGSKLELLNPIKYFRRRKADCK